MSNLNSAAFPASIGANDDYRQGFSKHEMATIMIAAGMASSFAPAALSREMLDAIAEDANYLAERILKQFER